MRHHTLIAALAVILLSVSALQAQGRDTLSLGRDFAQKFRQGEVEAVWQAMTQEMHAALGGIEQFRNFQGSITRQFGPEKRLLAEDPATHAGVAFYVRRALHDSGTTLLTQIAFDDNDKIVGFYVRVAPVVAASAHLDYQTKAALTLPFEGEWWVYWGGRTIDDNYHAADPGQRFAYDFVIRRDGRTHTGDAAKVEDYYCWGEAILAPAAGKVVASVDGLPDQKIGQSDPQHPAGNHVVLDLGNDEFLFLAHLRAGSVRAETGETVAQGDEIGRCGNSGSTSEPHLHLHMQTTPELGTGEGLPGQFQDYTADGKHVARGEPVRGQTISPGE